MEKKDIALAPRGEVSPYIVGPDGKKAPFGRRHNTLSYFSAEAMAAAFGGDPSFIPANVGFVFYPEQTSPSTAMDDDIGRNQDWGELVQDLADANADLLVVGFSYPPSLGSENVDSSSSSYGYDDNGIRNVISFHAITNSQDVGKIGGNAFVPGCYICQAVLLSPSRGGGYKILARVSLKDGSSWLKKPSGFEVALDWSIIFR